MTPAPLHLPGDFHGIEADLDYARGLALTAAGRVAPVADGRFLRSV